ncbi:MAG TPA: hypothetical protein PKH08_05960 [Clostridia bacterium]|nr:hypothetical protein [Clostridia bacterium]
MKLKAVIIILAVCLAVITAGAALNIREGEEYASADSFYIRVQKITSRTPGGSELVIAEKEWGRHIKIYYESNAPQIKLFYKSSSGSLKETGFISSFPYVFEVPIEGIITVTAKAYTLNETEIADAEELICEVYNDITPPPEPYVDILELDKYHKEDFFLSYCLYYDAYSQINFENSYLKFDSDDPGAGIELISLDDLLRFEFRYLYNNLTIKGNGVLSIYLEDCAGNASEYSYVYDKHGVPETGVPTVTLSTTEYAQSVTVHISWGPNHDNPFVVKKYALITATNTVYDDYEQPVIIDMEGEIELRVYYLENGEQKYITQTIGNVDKTPPSLTVMQDTADVIVDIKAAANPVMFRIKATDMLSGIKSVYFKTGGNLTRIENGYYAAPIIDMKTFTVVAEDNAGNKAEYFHNNDKLDFDTIKEYNQKFLALNRSEYASGGWAAIEDACDALSMLLMDPMAQSSDIAVAARRIDTAITGEIRVTNSIAAIPPGLDGGVSFSLPPSATDALKGEKITIVFGKASGDSLSETAGKASGINKRKVYAFSISLRGDSNAVSLTGGMSFNMPLPQGAVGGKIYVSDGGQLKELSCEVEGGRIYAVTTAVGDFYLVAEMGGNEGLYIGGRLYTWGILGATAGIIVGVCGAGFLVTYFVLKSRASKGKSRY